MRPAQWWWLVLDGAVDLLTEGRHVARLGPGDVLGPEPPGVAHLVPVDLVAHAPSTVLVARRPEIEALLASSPALAAVTCAGRQWSRAPADAGPTDGAAWRGPARAAPSPPGPPARPRAPRPGTPRAPPPPAASGREEAAGGVAPPGGAPGGGWT